MTPLQLNHMVCSYRQVQSKAHTKKASARVTMKYMRNEVLKGGYNES